MNKMFDPPVCVGFECVEPFTAPGGIERFRSLSRRYHVREAADTFCRLVKHNRLCPRSHGHGVGQTTEGEETMIPSALTDDELLRHYDELFRQHPATAELVSRFHGDSEVRRLEEEVDSLQAENARLDADLANAIDDKEALATALEDFLDDTSAVNAAAARKVLDGLK